MKRGLVHFIASDAHDCRHRSPSLSGAWATLAEQWGEDAIRPLFVDHPRAVLTGDTIDGRTAFAVTYIWVDAYLGTIDHLEAMKLDKLLSCHWRGPKCCRWLASTQSGWPFNDS